MEKADDGSAKKAKKKRGEKGGIEQLGKDRYLIRWFDSETWKNEHRRVYPSKVVHGTKRDAEKELRKRRKLVDDGNITKPNKLTVWTYLDGWLKEREGAKSVRERTIKDYRSLLEHHVKGSPFGEMKLGKIERRDVAKFYASLQSHERKAPLSARTVRMIHSLLSMAFNVAVDDGLMLRNPAARAERPKMVRTEKYPLTEEQATRFLAKAREQIEVRRHAAAEQRSRAARLANEATAFRSAGQRELAQRREEQAKVFANAAHREDGLRATDEMYFALWLVLLNAGLRPSEALALKWSSIVGSRINIRWSLDRYGNLNDPKTPKSASPVDVDGIVRDALDVHRRNQTEYYSERREAGAATEDKGFVFASQTGKPLDQSNIKQTRLQPLAKASGIDKERRDAGYPPLNLYDLRHTMATTLAAKGVHIKVVSERLRHASTRMTADVYTHVLPSMRQDIPEMLTFGQAKPAGPVS